MRSGQDRPALVPNDLLEESESGCQKNEAARVASESGITVEHLGGGSRVLKATLLILIRGKLKSASPAVLIPFRFHEATTFDAVADGQIFAVGTE